MRPEQTTTTPAAPLSHAIEPPPPHRTSAYPSKAVQNPSGGCQGYKTARASTLTALSTGEPSDARLQAPLPSAWPVLRQSVVKVAPSTTSNVRQRRPPAFTGKAWHMASNAHSRKGAEQGLRVSQLNSHNMLAFRRKSVPTSIGL